VLALEEVAELPSMKISNSLRLAVVLSTIIGLTALQHNSAFASDGMEIIKSPTKVKWGAVPPNLPRGGQLAVISGDASKAGTVYTLRLKMPDGYKFSPHWHPQDVYVTVISGTLGIGMGDKFDRTKGELVKTGGFIREPSKMHHYAWTQGPTVIQVYGEGPFVMNYVNPSDDPSTTRHR
jgi:hypothetical protein